jgi:hypothetical protein
MNMHNGTHLGISSDKHYAYAPGMGTGCLLRQTPQPVPPTHRQAMTGTTGSAVARLLSSPVDLNNADLQGKRVLYRVDLNLPLTQDHQVADATRLTSILPTLQLLLAKGACVVLCSHLGRPDPATQSLEEMQKEFSLAPVAQLLQQQLAPGTFTGLVPDCIGPAATQAVAALQPGQVRPGSSSCF